MDLKIKDKVYLVTGGGSGIGEAICKCLAEEEAKVMIVDKNEKNAGRVKEDILAKGGTAEVNLADLMEEEACKQAVEATLATFGRIDGLVNNAGLNDGVDLEKGNPKAFMESLRKNVFHYYALAHYTLPALKKHKGAIVNISSKVSLSGQGDTSGYAASKGGINALTREWAVELLPYSIRVNTVIPAEVWTPQYATWIKKFPHPEKKKKEIASRIPLGNRFTTTGEIADTVAFLLSERSGHTTGQILVVDGGYIHLDRAVS